MILYQTMKKSIAVFLILLAFGCQNQTPNKDLTTDIVNNSANADGDKNNDLPEIQFAEEEFDFGKIIQGEKVSHAFAFKNTGKKNLIITTASGSCGCTVPEYPTKPILPGETGKINVVFNSEGKSGLMEKTITVVTNCEPATRIIRIKTEIIVAETTK